MPYPNEHAARLQEPSKYKRFRRENDKFGDGIHAIWGIRKDNDKTELQSIRFDAKKWTVAEAKKWLKDHDFEPILFEPATGEQQRGFDVRMAGEDTADIYVYDFIGPGGTEAKGFVEKLQEVNGVKRLNVFINSPGGNVFDGMAMYNALLRHDAEVHVTVDGAALSAASLVAMAGDTIRMHKGSLMMIHNPWTMAIGTAEDMRKTADALDKIKGSIIVAYGRRMKATAEDIAAMMDAETWFTAEEAVAHGLAHEVVDVPAQGAWCDLTSLPFVTHVPEAVKSESEGKAKVRLDLLRRKLELAGL